MVCLKKTTEKIAWFVLLHAYTPTRVKSLLYEYHKYWLIYQVSYQYIIIIWILDLQWCSFAAPTQKVRREAANMVGTSIVSSLTSLFPLWHPIIMQYTQNRPNLTHTFAIYKLLDKIVIINESKIAGLLNFNIGRDSLLLKIPRYSRYDLI